MSKRLFIAIALSFVTVVFAFGDSAVKRAESLYQHRLEQAQRTFETAKRQAKEQYSQAKTKAQKQYRQNLVTLRKRAMRAGNTKTVIDLHKRIESLGQHDSTMDDRRKRSFESKRPDSIKMRLFVENPGTMLLYKNGDELHKKQPITLKEGDVIVIRMKSGFVNRCARMVFISTNKQWYLPVARNMLRVVRKPVDQITARDVKQSETKPGWGNTAPGYHRRWHSRGIPDCGSDWFWAGKKNEWGWCAFVVDWAMLRRIEKQK